MFRRHGFVWKAWLVLPLLLTLVVPPTTVFAQGFDPGNPICDPADVWFDPFDPACDPGNPGDPGDPGRDPEREAELMCLIAANERFTTRVEALLSDFESCAIKASLGDALAIGICFVGTAGLGAIACVAGASAGGALAVDSCGIDANIAEAQAELDFNRMLCER